MTNDDDESSDLRVGAGAAARLVALGDEYEMRAVAAHVRSELDALPPSWADMEAVLQLAARPGAQAAWLKPLGAKSRAALLAAAQAAADPPPLPSFGAFGGMAVGAAPAPALAFRLCVMGGTNTAGYLWRWLKYAAEKEWDDVVVPLAGAVWAHRLECPPGFDLGASAAPLARRLMACRKSSR
ncbi:MAG: hypothetical protein J3K34DRAFT_248720 [Monoraphidium minutum]|nr:MAG: hypothetical protein J3K34DRAFT_248720 [Monoraphidium minutum]